VVDDLLIYEGSSKATYSWNFMCDLKSSLKISKIISPEDYVKVTQNVRA
jgi:hypothetical protein